LEFNKPEFVDEEHQQRRKMHLLAIEKPNSMLLLVKMGN